MYEVNNFTLRNLQEQVLENKKQIALHWDVDRVLADFGIKVLGRLETADPYLTDPSSPEYINEGENYGDAYLVGPENQKAYAIYIWTRPNVNVGTDEAYWLYAGNMSIQGPQGPAGRSITDAYINNEGKLVLNFSDGQTNTLSTKITGEQGPRGKDGTSSRTIVNRETNGVRISTYDQNNSILSTAFINDGQRGSTGPQGPAGRNATLNIIGTFSSVEQAPDPAGQKLGDAFLLSNGTTTILYVLTGDDEVTSTLAWQETSFGGGTRVTVNGSVRDVWNADSKLNKMVPSGITPAVYASIDPYSDILYGLTTDNIANTVPLRDASGRIKVSSPNNIYEAANKFYVDERANAIGQQIDDLQDQINNLPQGGGSSDPSSWNTASGSYGGSIYLDLDYNKRYEIMLISRHGMGDNTYSSPVFLLPSGADQSTSVTNLTVPTMVGETENHWEVYYDPPAMQYSVIFIYNGETSGIHDITCYYRAI